MENILKKSKTLISTFLVNISFKLSFPLKHCFGKVSFVKKYITRFFWEVIFFGKFF